MTDLIFCRLCRWFDALVHAYLRVARACARGFIIFFCNSAYQTHFRVSRHQARCTAEWYPTLDKTALTRLKFVVHPGRFASLVIATHPKVDLVKCLSPLALSSLLCLRPSCWKFEAELLVTSFDFVVCRASVVALRYPASMAVSEASGGDRIRLLQRPEQSRLRNRVCDSFLWGLGVKSPSGRLGFLV